MSAQVAVVGLGISRISRRAEAPLGVLAVEASRAAVADAGLRMSDIDGVISDPEQPFAGASAGDGISLVTPAFLTRALGLDVNFSVDVDHPVVGMAMIQGINAVASGISDYCLVFRALHSPAGAYGFTNSADTGLRGSKQFDLYGVQPPGRYALQASEYFHRYGLDRKDLGRFVVQSRDYGLNCEWGYWTNRKPEKLTIEAYLASRMVSEPLCVYDCDLPVQVAGAYVITTAERARDLAQPPAYVIGSSAPTYNSLAEAYSGTTPRLGMAREAGRQAAAKLWGKAGIGPSDVDVAEFYDGFSILAPLWAEYLGFCGEGEGLDWVTNTRIAVNRSGGSLGTGRLHGLTHITEAISQVTGRSRIRQVDGARVSLAVVGSSPGTHLLFSSEC